MAETPDHFLHWPSVKRGGSRGERVRNGQAGVTSGEPFHRALGFAGFGLFLALAITAMNDLHVGGIPEPTALYQFAEQPDHDAARDRYAAGGSSDRDVAAGISPDVAILIEQHRALFAALPMAVPDAICR